MEQNDCSRKKRTWKQINEKKRYQIEALLKAGKQPKEIAKQLGYSIRTIQREMKKGSVEQMVRYPSPNREKGDMGNKLVYCADASQRQHDEKASNKGRNLKIGSDHNLARYIEDKIRVEHWSPDAVIGYIKANHLDFEVTICTKTLYNYISMHLFLGISNDDLLRKRDGTKHEYHRVRTVALNNRNGKSIEERPEAINQREEKGHWEMDLVVGKKGTKPVVLTLVERKSRKSIYILTKNKTQQEIILSIKRISKKIGGDFSQVIKTITTDNGSEFLDGAGIKEASGCSEIYYTHPFCGWEKGSNENGNSILRRFFPKGTDFGTITEEDLQRAENWVNNYPRKILGYKTANEVYASV